MDDSASAHPANERRFSGARIPDSETSGQAFEFHRVDDSQVDRAFAVLHRAGEWLRSTGRHQRVSKTSLQTYQQWQSEGSNFAVFAGSEIITVATLCRQHLDEWPSFSNSGKVLVLRSLATDPQFRNRGGSGAGEFAVNSLLKTAGKEPVFLDCVVGFLPEYYRRFGFQKIERRTLIYEGEAPYDVVLMKSPD